MKDNLEQSLKSDSHSSSVINAVYGVTTIDILSRILRLMDITTNATNFGCVTVENRTKWKVIDFRTDTLDYYTFVDIFRGFQQGNGMYNYSGFLGEVLRDRKENERMFTAKIVLNDLMMGREKQAPGERKDSFMNALKKAFYEITKYSIQHLQKLGINNDKIVLGELKEMDIQNHTPDSLYECLKKPDRDYGDFGRYIKAIEQKFFQLKTKVEERCDELTNIDENVNSDRTRQNWP